MEYNIKSFKKQNFLRRLTMPLPELEAYYREKRNAERDKEIKHIHLHRVFSKFFIFILDINRLFSGQTYKIVSDKRVKNGKARIYACTHVGGDDALFVYEAYKDQSYWFWGDVGYRYKTIDYLLVSLNGTIEVDTWDKTDRQNARNTAIKVLKKHGNILIFPEGTWNITENKPVMNLYMGAAEMSIESGADIIPVAVERYGNIWYINIGENISSENKTLDMKREFTAELRDAMATLKWEIFEQYGHITRAEMSENASEQWSANIQRMCDDTKFPMEDVVRTIYVTNADKDLREVQESIKHLIPSRTNAFLFSKRNHN